MSINIAAVRRLVLLSVFLLPTIFFSPKMHGQKLNLEVQQGALMLTGVMAGDEITLDDEPVEVIAGQQAIRLDIEPEVSGGLYFIKNKTTADAQIFHISQTINGPRVRHIPLWLSILPPLIAIALALLFKEVLISLFVGIWAGAFIANGFSMKTLLLSLVEVVEKYIVEALADSDHMAVIVFSMLIGGMVAIISKNGGMAGVVESLSRYAKDRKSSQFITWLLGVAIFFDDYANTLIVGNTMRSVTDKFKVSREKLAYIVDSTAAPVAAIAFITTWIGAELGYIDDGMSIIGGAGFNLTPYAIFIQSLKYSFYPILTLIFIILLIRSGKDYGPMHAAESRAHTTGRVSGVSEANPDEPNMEDLSPVPGARLHWTNAVIPVLTVIFVTMFGLFSTGMTTTAEALAELGVGNVTDTWSTIWTNMAALADGESGFFRKIGTLVGNSNSYTALLWASLSGVIMAIGLTVSKKIINLFDTMHWMTTGFKTMLPAILILTLAWSLAITTKELHTADFLTSLLLGNIAPTLMPALTFVLAAVIAFSTGSSWSTMAILYPIAIPTTWAITQSAGLSPDHGFEILLNVIAVVLAASVLGDHCSPISDTTILSSLASDCNHIDHVKTQLPYALTVGAVSLVACLLSALLGGGWLLSLVLLIASVAVLWLIIKWLGKPLPSSAL
jgi:Na+/H+ antiporter NhaC